MATSNPKETIWTMTCLDTARRAMRRMTSKMKTLAPTKRVLKVLLSRARLSQRSRKPKHCKIALKRLRKIKTKTLLTLLL